jgi:hypothetical protein
MAEAGSRLTRDSRQVAPVAEPEAARAAAASGRPDLVVPAIAAFVLLELLAFAGQYGFHRDELYFIVAGRHPAFGYPDQPPLVPLLTETMDLLGSGSLVVVRVPSALAAALAVVVTAATAREAGGGRGATRIAAGSAAGSAILLATGHFVTTTTFDVLGTAVLGWLLVRALIRRRPGCLAVAGVVTGVGFECKPQIALVAVAMVVALVAVGPRWAIRSPHLWVGAGLAVVLAAPYLVWQEVHGWPQIGVARAIAGSAEGGRAGFVPFQLVMVSPLLVPIWLAGMVAPWRDPGLRVLRAIPLSFGLVAAAYLVGDGKAYYLASMYPTLLGIGSVLVCRWAARGRARLRAALLGLVTVVATAASDFVALPVLPASALQGSAQLALNPDLGETVGWPEFVGTVAAVWERLPPPVRARAVVFTDNYGEAGAIDVLGATRGLPRAYSGHNGFGLWGPPPDSRTTTVLVGFDAPARDHLGFTGCRQVARISNAAGLDNQEYGGPVFICTGLEQPWSALWLSLRHLG